MKKLVVILGVAALAGNMVATQPDPDHLMEVCHNGRIITVDVASVPAHQAHGDTLGFCEGQEGDT